MDILGGAVSLYTQPQLPRILQKPVGWIRFPSVPVQVLEEADVRRVMGVSACEGWRGEGAGIECEVGLPPVKREGQEGGLPRKSLRPQCGPEKISTRLLGSPRIEMHPPSPVSILSGPAVLPLPYSVRGWEQPWEGGSLGSLEAVSQPHSAALLSEIWALLSCGHHTLLKVYQESWFTLHQRPLQINAVKLL